jgi:tripartite motif-containing protein 71
MPEQPPSFITKWGSQGEGDGQFHFPTDVALDSSDNVYVADTNNNRIQKFDSEGTFITKWGSRGEGDGQFNNPTGVALDYSDNVYVVDANNNRIQKFG